MENKIVLLPFDKVPEKCKESTKFGYNIFGLTKDTWDRIYKASLEGGVIIEEPDDIEPYGNTLCLNYRGSYFLARIECIDLDKTVFNDDYLPYIVNYC